jgi:hypothetical protein
MGTGVKCADGIWKLKLRHFKDTLKNIQNQYKSGLWERSKDGKKAALVSQSSLFSCL